VGDEKGTWLVRLAAGQDDEEVKPRMEPKSIGCGKSFRGKTALTNMAKGVMSNIFWLLFLS
jgi:DNA polymerase eta